MKKYLFIILVFIIFLTRIFYINYFKGSEYTKLLATKTNTYIYGESAPRGRILDRNGTVLVDNKGIKTLFYSKLKGITQKEEVKIAYSLARIINIKIDNDTLKSFWLILNNNGDDLIKEDEWQAYNERKLSQNDLKELKLTRITEEDINNLTSLDKKAATIYHLMNKGYSYQKKEIMKYLTDEEYSTIIDCNIKGLTIELTYERVYNYGDTLKDIFGRVGGIPEEEKDDYLKKGYELNDIVGLSYLELYYEDYLKGEKDLYNGKSSNNTC